MTMPTSTRGAGASAELNARRAADSKAVERAARVGLVARGLVYALIGLLALQVAVGNSSQRTDQKGALQTIAEKPGGSVVLWLMVIGLVALALWRFSQAAWGRRGETDEKKRTAKRVGSAASGLLYLGLAILAFRTVTGSSSSSSGSSGSDFTATMLTWPGGQALVVIIGLVIMAVAVGLAWRGLKTDFEKHLNVGQMSRTTFTFVRRLGQVGYVARGAVFFLIGVLVVKAGLDHQPGKAGGFDVALKSLAGAPGGALLLVLAALGLICFGAYSVAEARYRRLDGI